MNLRLFVASAFASLLLVSFSGSRSFAQTPVDLTSLSLGDAARIAAKMNPRIDVADARVEQARSRAVQRRGAFLPEINAGIQQASRTINTATFGFAFNDPSGKPLLRPDGEIIGPVPTLDLRYRVTQPIVDLAAVARWRSAQSSTRQFEAEAVAQAEGAAAVAAVAYVRAERAQAQVAARIADSTLAAELVGIARDQLDAGVGVALDVTRAQSQLSAARAALIGARNERDRSLLELKRAMGVSFDAPLTLDDSLAALRVDIEAPVEAGALEQAYSGRADVRALLAQEDAQRRAVSAVKWERTPQLGLVVDHGVIGKNAERLLPTYSWGVQLSLGLFDGFRRSGRLEEQQALLNEVDARLRDLRDQSALEVRSALLDLASAREQVGAANERLQFAEQELSQARDRFRAGVSGNADVITALMSLNQGRTLRNDALAAFENARVSLARATGTIRKLP